MIAEKDIWQEPLLSSIRPDLRTRIEELVAPVYPEGGAEAARALLDAAAAAGLFAIGQMNSCIKDAELDNNRHLLLPMAAALVAGFLHGVADRSRSPKYPKFELFVELLSLLASPDSYVDITNVSLSRVLQ